MAETKNQIAWNEIEKNLKFLKAINNEGEFIISASQIKDFGKREPRLMAKFDHSVNRPNIFKDNGISLLPVSRSDYILLKFDSFTPVTYPENSSKLDISKLKQYQTIDFKEIKSEDKAIIITEITDILKEFTNEKNIQLTNKGKFGIDEIEFSLNTDKGKKSLLVNKAGAELDAGYEGERFYIIEAKLGKIDDFNLRQLYYPYKYWTNRIKKPVVPIFLTFSDNTFTLWEYKFNDPNHFHSIEEVKKQSFLYSADEGRSIKDALNVTKFYPSDVEGIPFPQADDFEKVINVMELAHFSAVENKEDLADYFSFDLRQADYYFNAGKYLGLIDLEDGFIRLTDEGNRVAQLSTYERHFELIGLILSRKVFYDSFKLLETQSISIDAVVDAMKKNKVLVGGADSTLQRRAQTIISWCKWINEKSQTN